MSNTKYIWCISIILLIGDLNLFADRIFFSKSIPIPVFNLTIDKISTFTLSGERNGEEETILADAEINVTNVRAEPDPSFFDSLLFRIVVFLFVIVVIYIIMRLLYHRQNLKYSWELERMEKKKIEEINEAKIRFFTDLSHDLKTPLTLIEGPIEKLYKNSKPDINEVEKLLPVIYRNSKRLTILIEELLTFRKLNEGKLQLNAVFKDIVPFVKGILSYYEDSANEKKMKIFQEFENEKIEAWFDPFKMDQILHNLLSNSIKHGSENGKLEISVSTFFGSLEDEARDKKQTECVKFTIFNETPFIPQEKLDHIFDRFYMVDHNSGGTGIGLSVVKSLVKLHHGFISAKYIKEKGGISFEVVIPRQDDLLQSVEKKSAKEYISGNEFPAKLRKERTPAKGNQDKLRKSFTILLVEDNKDLRDFLFNSLSDNYKVKTAGNGEEGLELATELIPDVIVSDVVMPVMDGFELAKSIKENIQTSHIPVILLTARTSDSDKITGYQSGADAYVEKPFNLEVLLVQIQRVIKNREIMQKNFKEWVNKKERPQDISPEDHSFINLINKQIEANMSKGEISVSDIAETVGLSTTQVYRKVTALTNYTPIEYIRYYKLTRAQELLPHHKYSIKEIAYMSGFNDPSYFGKCFKKEFGMSPQAYRNNHVEYKV